MTAVKEMSLRIALGACRAVPARAAAGSEATWAVPEVT